MALTSSSVRLGRRRSSSLDGPPGPNRSSYFLNSMREAPKACRLPMTLLLNPVTIATIAMTVVTPTTTPSTVRPERSLCSRIERKANRTFSAKPRRSTSVSRRIGPSFIAQRLDRGEPGGRRGRRQAGENAGHGGDHDADRNEDEFDAGRENKAHRQRHERAEDHTDDAAGCRQQSRLQEKLPPDVPAPGAQRHAKPDL